mmetsp:Transcript_36230/g.108309  ORF Transcript_36230/g.108309 Transcript_36230/m.108309 type:complete len:421 (+) Transcript_36230:23-1285(+)
MTRGAWVGVTFVGASVLLPYNCILLAQAYFDRHAFRGLKFPFTSMLCYSAPLCMGQAVLTVIARRYTVSGRMWLAHVSGILICGILVVAAVLTHTTSATGVMYAVCLLTIVALALTNALMQTAILGLAGTMGPVFSGGVMLGFGVCGLAAFALSLLLEPAFRGAAEDTAGMLQATVLFVFCFVYYLASTWVYHGFLSRRVPKVMEALMALEESRQPAACDLQLDSADGASTAVLESGRSSDSSSKALWQSIASVLRRIAPQALNVWMVFAVTMSIFPGVMDGWKPQSSSNFANNPDLLATLLTGTFQIFDVVGRYLAEVIAHRVPPGRLWILVILRWLFVPAFMLGQRDPGASALWGSDWGRLLLVALMALTNGFAASCAMMFGPSLCEGGSREVAGIAMSFTMVTGIFCGTLLAFLTQL